MPRVHLVNPSTQSFGVASDTPSTCDATVALAEQADLTFAQFVLLTPCPGTVDFDKWAADENKRYRAPTHRLMESTATRPRDW